MIYAYFPNGFDVCSQEPMRLGGWGVVLDDLILASDRNLGQPSLSGGPPAEAAN